MANNDPAVASPAAAGASPEPSADAAPAPGAASAAAPAAADAPAPAVSDAPAADGAAYQPKPSLIESAFDKKAADDKPASAADGKPVDAAADKPADKAEDKPAEAKDKPADKPADKPKPVDAKDAPAKADEAPAPEPRVYEAFKVPEGLNVNLDDAGVKTLTAILDDPNLGHQERGQKLLDLYFDEANRYRQHVQKDQIETFTKMQEGWISDFVNDRDLGGNRQETTLADTARVIEEFGGTKEQQAELRKLLNYTGAGNNIHLIRLLHNVARKTAEGGIVPANPPKQSGGSRRDRWYNNSNGASR